MVIEIIERSVAFVSYSVGGYGAKLYGRPLKRQQPKSMARICGSEDRRRDGCALYEVVQSARLHHDIGIDVDVMVPRHLRAPGGGGDAAGDTAMMTFPNGPRIIALSKLHASSSATMLNAAAPASGTDTASSYSSMSLSVGAGSRRFCSIRLKRMLIITIKNFVCVDIAAKLLAKPGLGLHTVSTDSISCLAPDRFASLSLFCTCMELPWA